MINSNIVQVGLFLVDEYADNLFFKAFPLLQPGEDEGTLFSFIPDPCTV